MPDGAHVSPAAAVCIVKEGGGYRAGRTGCRRRRRARAHPTRRAQSQALGRSRPPACAEWVTVALINQTIEQSTYIVRGELEPRAMAGRGKLAAHPTQELAAAVKALSEAHDALAAAWDKMAACLHAVTPVLEPAHLDTLHAQMSEAASGSALAAAVMRDVDVSAVAISHAALKDVNVKVQSLAAAHTKAQTALEKKKKGDPKLEAQVQARQEELAAAHVSRDALETRTAQLNSIVLRGALRDVVHADLASSAVHVERMARALAVVKPQ